MCMFEKATVISLYPVTPEICKEWNSTQHPKVQNPIIDKKEKDEYNLKGSQ